MRAVNKEGDGANLETTHTIVAKNPYDEPGAPGEPEITDWDSVNKKFFSFKIENPVYFKSFFLESN